MAREKLDIYKDDILTASLISDFTSGGFLYGSKEFSRERHHGETVPLKNQLLKCKVANDRLTFVDQNVHLNKDFNNTVGLSETTLNRLRLFNNSLVTLNIPYKKDGSSGFKESEPGSVRSSSCARIARLQSVSCEDDVIVMMPSLWFNLTNSFNNDYMFEEKLVAIQVCFKTIGVEITP